MRFEELRKRMKGRPVFRPQDLHTVRPPRPHELVQLSRWVKEGRLVRLRRGLYTLPADERAFALHEHWLANYLYEPSYISLETALSYYDLIPEAVGTVTSVSTRKTMRFTTPVGTYCYRSLKPADFFGFVTEKAADDTFFWIALPEKALLDFLHLSSGIETPVSDELFASGFRFQNLNRLNPGVLTEMLSRFSVQRTRESGRAFLSWLDRESKNDRSA